MHTYQQHQLLLTEPGEKHSVGQTYKQQQSAMVHTHAHTQPFYGSLDSVWENTGKPVPEETFTPTYLSWSSVIPYLLPPSITIHGICPVQFTCLAEKLQSFFTISLQVFFGLPLSLAPSTSYSIHFFTQSLSSFHSTYPYHHNLF